MRGWWVGLVCCCPRFKCWYSGVACWRSPFLFSCLHHLNLLKDHYFIPTVCQFFVPLSAPGTLKFHAEVRNWRSVASVIQMLVPLRYVLVMVAVRTWKTWSESCFSRATCPRRPNRTSSRTSSSAQFPRRSTAKNSVRKITSVLPVNRSKN